MKGKRERLHKGAEEHAFTVTSVAVQLLNLKSQTLPKHTQPYFPFLCSELRPLPVTWLHFCLNALAVDTGSLLLLGRKTAFSSSSNSENMSFMCKPQTGLTSSSIHMCTSATPSLSSKCQPWLCGKRTWKWGKILIWGKI